MKLTLEANRGGEYQDEFTTEGRETFELDGKTWRIEYVIVRREGIWIAAERQTRAGKDYVRGHSRAVMFGELPADVAAAIVDALRPAPAASAAPTPVDPERTRISEERLGNRVITRDDSGLGWAARAQLSAELAEREGINRGHATLLIEAACSGLPVTVSWFGGSYGDRREQFTAVVLVLAVKPGRLRLRYAGFEHNIFIGDLASVEALDRKCELVPVGQEKPEVAAPVELPDAGELLALGKTGGLATMRPGNAGLSNESLKLFLDYARDAGNWGGTPLVGGNVDGSYEANGYLLHLKQAGLLTTDRDGRDVWIYFTQKGYDFAAEHGVTIPVR